MDKYLAVEEVIAKLTVNTRSKWKRWRNPYSLP